MHDEEMKNKKPLPLTLDKTLFVGIYVPNIVVKHHGQTVGGSSYVSKATRKNVLSELMEVLKYLQETITTSTVRKKKRDELIKVMNKKEETNKETSHNEEEEEE